MPAFVRWRSSFQACRSRRLPRPQRNPADVAHPGVPVADGQTVKLPRTDAGRRHDGRRPAAADRGDCGGPQFLGGPDAPERGRALHPETSQDGSAQGRRAAASTCGSSPTEAWTPWPAMTFSATSSSRPPRIPRMLPRPGCWSDADLKKTRLARPVGSRRSALRGSRDDAAGAGAGQRHDAIDQDPHGRVAHRGVDPGPAFCRRPRVSQPLATRSCATTPAIASWASRTPMAGSAPTSRPRALRNRRGDLDRISRRLRGTARVVQRREPAAIQAADPRPNRRPQAAAPQLWRNAVKVAIDQRPAARRRAARP